MECSVPHNISLENIKGGQQSGARKKLISDASEMSESEPKAASSPAIQI